MKIAVTGGKGGTGKSTVATALAHELAQDSKVLLVDADVGCPNDHLILGLERSKVKDVETMVPRINKEKCTKCGKCAEVCRENAIVQVKDQHPMVLEKQCIGCRACKIACPTGAIEEGKQVIGKIFEAKAEFDFVSAEIETGVEESSLVVNALKDYFKDLEDKYDHIVIDTAAGTHCPVISALLGSDLGLAVTEPTPLGEHDLGLILELMEKLGVKSKVIVNRSNIADQKGVRRISGKFGAEVVAEIPYSKEIEKKYAKGEVITHPKIKKIVEEEVR